MPQRTPLYDEHRILNARFTDFGGWEMPVQYTSIMEEHAAVRTAAGIFDTGHMGVVRVKGERAADWIARLTPLAMEGIAVGQAKYTFFLNDRGGIVDDLIVYRNPNDYLLVINAGNREKDIAWMREHPVTGAALEDLSAFVCLIALQGPRAQAVLQTLVTNDLSDIAYFRYAPCTFTEQGLPIMVARTGYTGEDGFELFAPAGRAAELWRALIAAGARPCGLGARDTLRLEAAMPLHGHEISDDVTPLDAGLGRYIRWENDFIGRAALRRQKDAGSARTLAGFTLKGGVPRAGCAVRIDGTPAGSVTSGTYSPTLRTGIALALIDRPLAPGTAAEIEVHGSFRPATTVALPFYRRPA